MALTNQAWYPLKQKNSKQKTLTERFSPLYMKLIINKDKKEKKLFFNEERKIKVKKECKKKKFGCLGFIAYQPLHVI